MPNEDGQFELTLGNRQLLSVFFIVVILLGVFFTMGYIVGKNSSPLAPEAVATRKDGGKPSLVVVSPAQSSDSGSTSGSASTPTTAATPVPVVTLPVHPAEPQRTEPVRETAKAEPERKSEKVADKKVAEKKAEKPVEKAERKEPRPARGAEGKPAAGQSYLQLAATNKREADVMIDVLRQKGFRAIAAEKPDQPGLFRVLVGPIGEGGSNKMKSDLQAAGFPGNAAIRRNF